MENTRLHVQLYRIPQVTSADEHENRTQRLAQWHQLARAYDLGGFLLAPAFQNAVMDHLVSASQGLVNEHNEVSGITPPTLEFLYEKTSESRPMEISARLWRSMRCSTSSRTSVRTA